MEKQSELEKYINYGLSGTPQIKADEKRRWLGEFRERVVFALTFEQINRKEAVKVVEEKCKDERVDKIIVESSVLDTVIEKFMDIAKKYNKDYKTVDMQNTNGEIALVLASSEAVNESCVLIEKLPVLPDIFYHAKSKKLCKEHMEILKKEAPMFIDEFEEITFLDKMIGIKCGVCESLKK
ncbi:YueI family protein [Crassaminicella indica]|uniref:YueI family protein n=1 Tax=Crassaminicella indica TaxID=2855394 RepID=A0ABX8RCC4_9CLOT|nr:YueI family protein [Crassaminicella indica]QXM06703.1 YueI family protein [Crassaminicella indica]